MTSVYLNQSHQETMYVARHMNGRLEEVEEGQAEFRVIYDRSNTSFLWSISVASPAFIGFISLNLKELEKNEPVFMRAISKMIEKREQQTA